MNDTDLAALITDFGKQHAADNDNLKTRIGELEKRAANERDRSESSSVESIAQKLVDHPDFNQFNGGRARAKVAVESAAITTANSTVGAGRSAGTSLIQADRQAGIITAPERAMTVRDLLAPGTTTSNNIEYIRETGFTNNAAPVAETTQKPYSDLTFDMANAPVRTIAHLFKISKQMLDDGPAMISMIDVRGTYGLKLKEEQQLLRGDGTGQNILGLIPQATQFAPAFVPQDSTRIDRLRLAILQVRKAEYRASGIVLNPDDLAQLELTKDADGRYIYVNVVEGGENRLWKLPVIDSTVMNSGEFLVGAFNIAGQVFDRQQAVLEVSTENADDFEKNMATARIEERLALAVYRPESFVHGSFTD